MHKFWFYSQSKETDADGFYLQDEAAKQAEIRALQAMKAPDADKISIISIEAIDLAQAEVEAYVTQAFEDWAREQEIAIEEQ